MIKGRPMIERVYGQVKKAKLVDVVLVATDHRGIFQTVKAFGGKAVMTSPRHRSGTDRIAEAVKGKSCSFILNVQGDEPLIPPGILDRLVRAAKSGGGFDIYTVVTPVKSRRELNNPNVVKTVLGGDGSALYFSRQVIPSGGKKYYRHIGIYLYSGTILRKIVKLKQSPLEKAEKLEQLRALENGLKIKALTVKDIPPDVNVPGDIKIIEKYFKGRNFN
jgi:3-deoxy-manno-octulosonate cytidylyltransferase (CMP-KDO synthetase)